MYNLIWTVYKYNGRINKMYRQYLYYDFNTGAFEFRDDLENRINTLYEIEDCKNFKAKFAMTSIPLFKSKWDSDICDGIEIYRTETTKVFVGYWYKSYYLILGCNLDAQNVIAIDNCFSFDKLNVKDGTFICLDANPTLIQLMLTNKILLNEILSLMNYQIINGNTYILVSALRGIINGG